MPVINIKAVIVTVELFHILQVSFTALSINIDEGKQVTCRCRRDSKIQKGQTEIVNSENRQDYGNKMKRKTNIEHTILHWKLKLELHEPNKKQG